MPVKFDQFNSNFNGIKDEILHFEKHCLTLK